MSHHRSNFSDLNASRPATLPKGTEFVSLSAIPGQLMDRKFDFIVAHDMLVKRERGCCIVSTIS